MTRTYNDQACLDAQVRSQVAQSLTAELAVPCPECGARVGAVCRQTCNREPMDRVHLSRRSSRDTEPCPAPTESLERASARAFYEQIVQDMAGSAEQSEGNGMAGAPRDASSEAGPPAALPVCACGQTIWNELTVCGDCRAENVSALLCMPQPAPLDQRIREAQPDDATECAWSTPTSDGEGWR